MWFKDWRRGHDVALERIVARWYMEQLEREVAMQTAPLKLYLSEDFAEAAHAFVEKRKPGPFKGR